MTGAPSNNDCDENGAPGLSIDWELYADYLEESDLTDEQKREFIETLWNIVIAFVDLGFGIHPLQQACEQNSENRINLPDDLVSSFTSQKTESGVEVRESTPSLQSSEPMDSKNKNEEVS